MLEKEDEINEKYTKIYRKTGELECSSQLDTHTNEKLENLQQKLIKISQDEDLYDFVLTAINAIDDENALKELKILINHLEKVNLKFMLSEICPLM